MTFFCCLYSKKRMEGKLIGIICLSVLSLSLLITTIIFILSSSGLKQELKEEQENALEAEEKHKQEISLAKKKNDSLIEKCSKSQDELESELKETSAVQLMKQKELYEEKLLSLRNEKKAADELAQTEFTNLESKYGEELSKRKRISNEMLLIRQKLANIDMGLQETVSSAYRIVDSGYGRLQQQAVQRPPQPVPQQQFAPSFAYTPPAPRVYPQPQQSFGFANTYAPQPQQFVQPAYNPYR